MPSIWKFSAVTTTVTPGSTGAGSYNRPILDVSGATYDPSYSWDPDSGAAGEWLDSSAMRFAGGGRYNPKFVVIGMDATGKGRIYFS